MAQLKQVAGFWLPAGEKHLVPVLEASARFYKGPTYQVDKLLACLPWIRGFGTAVDVGAHCGLWSRVLVHMFGQLHAFEPHPVHAECFRRNVPGVPVHEVALGAEARDQVFLKTAAGSSGDTCIAPSGKASAPMTTLDALRVLSLDFLKIDCEGFEAFVVRGGEASLKRTRPCILVEQKAGYGAKYGLEDLAAVTLLKSWGAEVRFEMSGDYCLSWDR